MFVTDVFIYIVLIIVAKNNKLSITIRVYE